MGSKDSSIDTRTNINSNNVDELGKYENPVSDGWWFFIFEVQISLGTSNLDGWHFNQSVVSNTDLILLRGGELFPIHQHDEDPIDKGLAESPTFSQFVGSTYYWIDEPARRKVHVIDGDPTKWPVVSGTVVWDFVMAATNSKDPRRSCSVRFQLTLSIGSKIKWKGTS
jgi:hypothetical protein